MRSQGHAVESVCRVLSKQGCKIAARTYRSAKSTAAASSSRGVSARVVEDAQVADVMRSIAWTVDEHGPMVGRRRLTPEGLYGRRKWTALMQRRRPGTSPGSVDRAMRVLGLEGVRRAKGIRTTIPARDGIRAGDLLDRDFSAAAPNRKWVMDFTYCRTWAGWTYVAFVVDCYAQKIVGWHASTVRDTDLVMTPLRMAIWQRSRENRPLVPGELIAHSDAGTQYVSLRFTEHLALEEIHPSIGSVGDAYDNGLMESIIGLFKTECIRTTVFHSGPFRTLADVEFATAGWVDWYNQRRLHSSLGYATPVEYETAHDQSLNRVAEPV